MGQENWITKLFRLLSIPIKNSSNNNGILDVIGNKEDDEDGNSIVSRLYMILKHVHSRNYTYPYKSAAIVVTGGSGSWVEGSKIEIVPVATNDIQTFTITHGADADGYVDIRLDDVVYTVPIVIGDINSVASQIRNAGIYYNHCSDCGWVTSGTGADVIFTALGKKTTGTFLDVDTITGVTATIVHTTPGVGIGNNFDIHFFTPSAPSATTTYQINFWSGLSGRESRIGTKRIIKASAQDTLEPIPVQSPVLDAGTRISCSISTLSGATDSISVAIDYHTY